MVKWGDNRLRVESSVKQYVLRSSIVLKSMIVWCPPSQYFKLGSWTDAMIPSSTYTWHCPSAHCHELPLRCRRCRLLLLMRPELEQGRRPSSAQCHGNAMSPLCRCALPSPPLNSTPPPPRKPRLLLSHRISSAAVIFNLCLPS